MQEMVDMLPPSKVGALPEIEIVVRKVKSVNGSYNKWQKKLVLSSANLQDPATARKTIFHELLHWAHDHGDPAYAKRVKDLFDRRTMADAVENLRPYNTGKITGKRDKWMDADGDEYAGRIYNWEKSAPQGLEVVTRHLEKLANADNLAKHWNHSAPDGSNPWREAFIELSTLLFP
jgi:hypothetical protein